MSAVFLKIMNMSITAGWSIQKEGESYNTFENRQHEFCDKIRKMLS